jgi:hypothetical protein
LLQVVKPTLQKIRVLAAKDKADEIAKVKSRLAGNVSDLIRNPPEFLTGYEYEFIFENRNRADKWAEPMYMPSQKLISVRFNTELPSLLKRMYQWDDFKVQFLRDTARIDSSLRHEVTHMIRDAQTHHIERYLDRRQKDRKVYEEYQQSGHQTLEFEIDAIVNSMDQLKKRLGPARYDKLTPERMSQMLPGFNWPTKPEILQKWIKRLQREGLLTSGMQRAWKV